MKKLMYSPDALDKMKSIKADVADKYGIERANTVISNMKKAFHRLQQFEYSGIAVERAMGIPCDYYMLFVVHNYVFYRIDRDVIRIIDIYHEREDFVWRLFGIKTTSDETEEYWGE